MMRTHPFDIKDPLSKFILLLVFFSAVDSFWRFLLLLILNEISDFVVCCLSFVVSLVTIYVLAFCICFATVGAL